MRRRVGSEKAANFSLTDFELARRYAIEGELRPLPKDAHERRFAAHAHERDSVGSEGLRTFDDANVAGENGGVRKPRIFDAVNDANQAVSREPHELLRTLRAGA